MANTKTKKVAKKVPSKRTVPKSAVKKTSSPRKSGKPAVSKRTTAKKTTAKKTTAKKTTAKKTTVNKSISAKSPARRPSVKKAASKKNVKSTVKKIGKTSTVSSGIRAVASTSVTTGLGYSVPEVPVRKASPKKLGVTTEVVQSVGSKSTIGNAVQYEKSYQKAPKGILLAVLVLGGVAFAIFSLAGSNEMRNASKPDASPSPTISISNIASPSPTPSEAAQIEKTFTLRYLYNSIGITINFADALSLGNVKKIELMAQPSSGSKIKFGSYTGSTSTVRIAKIDTVGQTKFTALAKLADGTTITSSTLTIRGEFESI